MCFFSLPTSEVWLLYILLSLFRNCFAPIACDLAPGMEGWISGAETEQEVHLKAAGQEGGEELAVRARHQLVGTLLLQLVSLLLASCQGSQGLLVRFLLHSLPCRAPTEAPCPQGRSASDPSSHAGRYTCPESWDWAHLFPDSGTIHSAD